MKIDLDRVSTKVLTTDSEREIDPAVTVENVLEAFGRLDLHPQVEVWNHEDVFWTSRAFLDEAEYTQKELAKPLKGLVNGGRATEGKGMTRDQCLASCLMELAERFTLAQHADRQDTSVNFFECFNLRTRRIDTVLTELYNAGHCGAGNTYEECVLHGLHETIELALPDTQFIPVRLINIDNLFPEWPRALLNNVLVFQIPSTIPCFYKMVAVRPPEDGQFDAEWSVVFENGMYMKRKRNLHIKKPGVVYPEYDHTVNAGSAAGLNPKACIRRAVQESFQGPGVVKEFRDSTKCIPPDFIEVVDGTSLKNYEMQTISGDIKVILDALGDDVYVGAIDLTSPDLGIPLVRMFSDVFMPPQSLGTKTVLDMFYADL